MNFTRVFKCPQVKVMWPSVGETSDSGQQRTCIHTKTEIWRPVWYSWGGFHIRRCPLIFWDPNFFKDCLPSFLILLIISHKAWLLNIWKFLTAPFSYFVMQFMNGPLHSRVLPQTIDAQWAPTSSFPTHNSIHYYKGYSIKFFSFVISFVFNLKDPFVNL